MAERFEWGKMKAGHGRGMRPGLRPPGVVRRAENPSVSAAIYRLRALQEAAKREVLDAPAFKKLMYPG